MPTYVQWLSSGMFRLDPRWIPGRSSDEKNCTEGNPEVSMLARNLQSGKAAEWNHEMTLRYRSSYFALAGPVAAMPAAVAHPSRKH